MMDGMGSYQSDLEDYLQWSTRELGSQNGSWGIVDRWKLGLVTRHLKMADVELVMARMRGKY